MDMWGRLNKGLQVVQNQLDTYVDTAGVDPADERPSGESSASSQVSGDGDAISRKVKDLEEALEQSESRNRLVTEEFKQLLREKDKEVVELRKSSETPTSATSDIEGELREALSKKDEQWQDLEAKSEAKLTRLKQQAKAKITSLQEQVTSLQQELQEKADTSSALAQPSTDSTDGSHSAAETSREADELKAQLEESQRTISHLENKLQDLKNARDSAAETARDSAAETSPSSNAEEAIASLRTELAAAVATCAAERAGWEQASAELRATVRGLEEQVAEKTRKVRELELENVEEVQKTAQLEEEVTRKTEELDKLDDQDVASQAEIMGLQAQIESCQSEGDGALEAVRAQLADQAQELSAVKAEHAQIVSEAHEERATLTSSLEDASRSQSGYEKELERLSAELRARDEEISRQYSGFEDSLAAERRTLDEKLCAVTEQSERQQSALQLQLDLKRRTLDEKLCAVTEQSERQQSALQLQLDQLREELSIQTDQLEQELASRNDQLTALQSELEAQRDKVSASTSATSIGSALGSSNLVDVPTPSTPPRRASSMMDSWTPVDMPAESSSLDMDSSLSVESLQQALVLKEQALKDLNAKAEVKFEKLKMQAKKKLSSLQQQHAAEKDELVKQWQQRVDMVESEQRREPKQQEQAPASGIDVSQGSWEKSLEERLHRIQELEQTPASARETGITESGAQRPVRLADTESGTQRPVRLADLKKKCEELGAENADLSEKVEALSAENSDLMSLLNDSRRPSGSAAGADSGANQSESDGGESVPRASADDGVAQGVTEDMTAIASEVDKKLNVVLSSVATFLFQVKEQLGSDGGDVDVDVEECRLPTEHDAMTQSVTELCRVTKDAQRKHADLLQEHMSLSMSMSVMQQSLHESQSELASAAVDSGGRDEAAEQVQVLRNDVESARRETGETQERLEQLTTSLAQKDDALAAVGDLHQQLADRSSELSALRTQLDEASRQLHAKEEECTEVVAEQSTAQAALEAARSEIADMRQSASSLQASLQEGGRDVERLRLEVEQSVHGKESVLLELEQSKQQLATCEVQLQAATEELHNVTASRVQLEIALKQVEVQSESVEREHSQRSSAERSGLVDELRLWRNKAEDAESQVSSMSTQLADLQLSWSEKNGEISALRRQLEECDARRKSLAHETQTLGASHRDGQAQLNTVLTNLRAAQASAAQQLASSEAEQKRLQRQVNVLQERATHEEQQRRLAQEESASLAEEKLRVEKLYADYQVDAAARDAQRGQESYSAALFEQQISDAETTRQQLQSDLDLALNGLRDREAQSLQLSSEVARLTGQQNDVEQQMRQMARQRDVAQSQEDQLRSQLLLLQATADSIPQLHAQLEVSGSSLRDTSRKLLDREQECRSHQQAVGSLTDQVQQLEADRRLREQELQEEVRTVQLRKRELERDLADAMVDQHVQTQVATSSSDDGMTDSTVLVPYPVDSEDMEKLEKKLTAETAKTSTLERELGESRQQIQDLLKQHQEQQNESAQHSGMDISINMGNVPETDGTGSWSLATDGSTQPAAAAASASASSSSQFAMLSMVFGKFMQQLRLHSLGLTRRLARAQPSARMAFLVYLICLHIFLLLCVVH